MARYSDTLRDMNGRPVAGALVSVVISATNVAATLTTDSALPLSNPFVTDTDGAVIFNVSDNIYDIEYRYGGRLVATDYGIVVGTYALPTGLIADSLGTATGVAPSQRAVSAGLAGKSGIAATRAAMAALPVVAGTVVVLAEVRRGGTFIARAGSTPSDPQQGIYVASTTTGFYYERIWDGTRGYPEWFGAIVNDQSKAASNLTALSACHLLCPVMICAAGTYYVSGTFKLSRSDSALEGAGPGYGGNPATTISVISTSLPAFQFGADSYAAVARGQTVRNISFGRVGTAITSPTGKVVDCPKSFVAQWTTNSRIENCRVLGSPVGFYFTFTSNLTVSDANTSPATSAGADFSIGFLVGGYSVFPGFVGNNGSIRIYRATAYTFPACGFSAHTLMIGMPADTWMYDCEGSLGQYGIAIDGRDGSGGLIATAGAHQDIRVHEASMDGFSQVGIHAHNLNSSASVEIEGHYIASCSTAIALDQIGGGCVSVGAGKAFASAGGQIGLTANTVGFLSIRDTFLRDFAQPMILANCNGHIATAEISNLTIGGTTAVDLINCDRGFVRPSIKGMASAFTNAVAMDGACGYSEINGSGIDPGCLVSASAAYKVRYNGADASTGAGATAFTAAGNVLSGVIG